MRGGLLLLAVLLLAGCGAAAEAPKPVQPKLPRALAQSWAQQSDAVAAALADGDGCTAQARAAALQTEVIAAVNDGRVPHRFLEPLTSGVNAVAGGITCTPPAPPADEDRGKKDKKERKDKKWKRRGHDE